MPYKPLVSKIRVHNPNKKGTAVANRNYVTYIATREGVALDGIKNIDDLLKNDKILESNLNENIVHQEASDEGYVRYMARRPRSHGLFGNIDTEDLGKVAQQVNDISKQGRVIYRGIISLSKEDAEELGFRNTEAWNNYMKRVMPDIAQKLGVSVTDHTWIAAFHSEESHPHVHYELWDNRDRIKSPFIHVSVQKSVRNMLSEEMFDDNYERTIRDLYQDQLSELKENRNKERASLLEYSKNFLHEIGYVPGVEYERLPDKIKSEDLKNIATEANKLIKMLPASGRLTYKFLPKEAKEQLTKLSNIIMQRIDMQREMKKYLNSIESMHSYYGETKTEIETAKSMRKADVEKRIKNAILKELKEYVIDKNVIADPVQSVQQPSEVVEDNYKEESYSYYQEEKQEKKHYYIDWGSEYKDSMKLLYGKAVDVEKAFEILNKEAQKGNVIAIDKVAKLIDKNLIDAIDKENAENYFSEARTTYNNVYYKSDKEYQKFYAAYREGKLYDMGKGGEQNYLEAEKWYRSAGDNKFAQYSLGKIYLDNKISLSSDGSLETNYREAFHLFENSAKRGNPFASYELGNMYSKGLGTGIDQKMAQDNYKIAYDEFVGMLEKTTDDNLLYRVGKMTYYGIGTKVDVERAVEYYEKAAKIGNENAQFALAKIYVKQDDPEKLKWALDTMEKLAENNNSLAQYSMGAFFSDPEGKYYDMEKAITYLEQSATQDNEYAQYKLGTIHADPEGKYYDLEKAISYLKQSAAQDNEYAQYKLGTIHADSEGKYYDMEKAISYLEQSAAHGNEYAQYKVGKIYLDRNNIYFNSKKAAEYLEKAAQQENKYAKYVLGMYYTNPDFGEVNIKKANEYFMDFKDDKFVQMRLASVYLNQSMGYYNPEVAVRYLTRAAEQGMEYAQYKLGAMYYFGNDVNKDINIGRMWLSKAADQGNLYAKDILENESLETGISYMLVKAALASVESMNQQNLSAQNNISRSQSKQAQKEMLKHRNHKEQTKGHEFVGEIY